MKQTAKEIVRSHFSATHIAYMALFTALAFVVSFWEFPIFPAPADFLKIDFANIFFMIEGFILGPVEAILSIGVKELFCFMKTMSGGAGEVANFLMSTAYVIIPSIAYRFKKGRGWVALYLACACVLQIAVSLPVNRYITYPFFLQWDDAAAANLFDMTWGFVLAFNAIKGVAVSLVVFVIYKPLSRIIKMTAEKFSKKHAAPAASNAKGEGEENDPVPQENK